MEKQKIRVLVVDDHFMVRVGLAGSLNSEADLEVVGEAEDGAQAVAAYGRLLPDVVILDLRLPDMSGIDALARIREAHPEARAIILSTFDGSEDIHRSFETGSRCFLRKDVERDELLRAVREVAAGRRVVTGLAADRLAERMSHQPLTEREHQVLTLIVRGRSNKEIAADLNISEVTVKAHVSRVLEKLGVEDRTQAATAALRRGIVHAQWPER